MLALSFNAAAFCDIVNEEVRVAVGDNQREELQISGTGAEWSPEASSVVEYWTMRGLSRSHTLITLAQIRTSRRPESMGASEPQASPRRIESGPRAA